MTAPTAAVLTAVYERDHGMCAMCGLMVGGRRGFDWSLHHRRPRGAGGSTVPWVNLPANLILLHGSGVTGCHGLVESQRDRSRRDGFLVPLNGMRRACEVPILHAVHHLCLLTDDGYFINVGKRDQ